MKKLDKIKSTLSLTALFIAILIVFSSCNGKQITESKDEVNPLTSTLKKEYSQFVFETTNLYRYEFPTHINDIIVDRAQSSNSEVFMVLVKAGKSVHHHQHDDTEQIFYMIEGTGVLTIGENKEEMAVKPGDVVRIPVSTLHSIRPDTDLGIKYLCVDCFGSKQRLEPTWDEHVHVVCKEQGYDYNDVVASNND